MEKVPTVAIGFEQQRHGTDWFARYGGNLDPPQGVREDQPEYWEWERRTEQTLTISFHRRLQRDLWLVLHGTLLRHIAQNAQSKARSEHGDSKYVLVRKPGEAEWCLRVLQSLKKNVVREDNHAELQWRATVEFDTIDRFAKLLGRRSLSHESRHNEQQENLCLLKSK